MRKKTLHLFLLSLLFTASPAFAATYYSIASGNWTSPNVWSTTGWGGAASSSYPGQLAAGDMVFISGYTINILSTPAYVLNKIELNQFNSFSLLDTKLQVGGSSILTCTSFLMLDNNVDSHMELDVYAGGQMVVSGLAQVTRSITNAKDKRMSIRVANPNSKLTVNALNYFYGRAMANETAANEIFVEDFAQLLVNGALNVTMGNNDGDNNKMDIVVQSSGKIDALSLSYVLKNSDDGDDIITKITNASFKVTGTWNETIDNTAIAGNSITTSLDGGTLESGFMNCYQNGGGAGDLSFLINKASIGIASVFKVNGDLNFSHSDGDNMVFETNKNCTAIITGSFITTVTSGSNGDVVLMDLNGGTVQIDNLLKSTVVSNNNYFKILIDGAAVTVKGIQFEQQGVGTGDMQIYLNSSSGTTPTLLTVGILGINFIDNGGDNMDIVLWHNSKVTVNGNVLFNNNAASGNDRMMVRLNGGGVLPVFEVTGNFFGNLNTGTTVNDQVCIDINDGTFKCNGNLTLTTAPACLAGSHCFIEVDVNSSTLNVIGNVKLDHQGGGTTSNDYIYVGLLGSSNFTAGSLTLNGQGGNFTHLKVYNSSIVKVNGNINLSASAAGKVLIELNQFAILQILGSFIRGTPRYGSLKTGINTTVIYSGASNQQTIAGDAGAGGDSFLYYNVTISNTYSVKPQLIMTVAEGNATINSGGGLSLTQGIVSSNASAMLVLANNAGSNWGNPLSFVDGPIKKVGNMPLAYTFPVGNNGYWARLAMNTYANFGPTTEFVCSYHDAPSPNNTPLFMGNTKGPALNHVSYVEYWDLQRTFDVGNDASCFVSLHWENSSRSVITSGADLRVAHFESTGTGKWENYGMGGITNGLSGWIGSGMPISVFSPVTFGSAAGINPLPVELTKFSASVEEPGVRLIWETASETNNDYFTLERSDNGKEYDLVERVKGAGTSSVSHGYSVLDLRPYSGTIYYRLRQTDFDGHYEYPGLLSVSDQTLDPGSFRVYDLAGRMLREERNTAYDKDLLLRFNSLQLQPGLYIISRLEKGRLLNEKVLIGGK